jgi:hypothetical protein
MAEPDYFTKAELQALPDMSGETEARILAAAAWAVGVIEREVGTSFVARTVTDEVHDGGREAIALDKPFVISVTSATENSVAVTDTLRAARGGVLRRFSGATSFTPTSWAAGTGNVSVTYQAGYSSTPPADIKEAALQATRWHLLEQRASNVHSPRQTSITNEMGGTVNFAVAGTDRPTGYPDVDAVIVGWRNKLNVFGFA